MTVRTLLTRVKDSVSASPKPYETNPSRYWDRRHKRHGESLDGVGQIGLGHVANESDYMAKWTHLQAALDATGVGPDTRALDAGCGIGWVSERLHDRGHVLTCADFSAEAIRIAEDRLVGKADFRVQELHEPVPGAPFDLVLCVDVLFHIVSDARWRRTVRNLGTMCEFTGTLAIQEHLVDDQAASTAEHVRFRTKSDYVSLLEDWTLVHEDRYLLPEAGTTKDILVWRRTDHTG